MLSKLCLIASALVALLALAAACGDDAPARPSPAATEAATVTPAPTPLDRIECAADLPDVTLESAGASQAALPLVSEWAGPDCVNGGPGAAFYYIETESLEVAAGDSPTLVISQQPEGLSALVWPPDLTSSTVIAGGETALPMDPPNVARRFNPTELDVRPIAEQQLDLTGVPPGDYAIELFGEWPDGVATLSFHIVITG